MESKRNFYNLLIIGLQLLAIAMISLSWYKIQALTRPKTEIIKSAGYLKNRCPKCDSSFSINVTSSPFLSAYESYPGKVISIAFDPHMIPNPGTRYIQIFFDWGTGEIDPKTSKLYDLVYAHIKVYFSAKAGDKPSPTTPVFDLFDYQDSFLEKNLSTLGFSDATPVLCLYNSQSAGSRAVIWTQY